MNNEKKEVFPLCIQRPNVFYVHSIVDENIIIMIDSSS